LATAAKELAENFGSKFQKAIEFVKASVISGMLIKRFSRKKRTQVLAKQADRPIIWNVGTTV
jgi:hypothetical protein